LKSSVKLFANLQQEIIQCRLCPRLVEWRERIAREKAPRFRTQKYWGRPLPSFGDPTASLIIIGLAPAAHGGNRTGRMFTGDRSGDWLYEALYRFGFATQPSSLHKNDGLALLDCLITAAVRCAPPNNKPLPPELDNCRRYLRHELELMEKKRVIVVLGRIALQAFLKARRETGHPGPAEPIVFRHGGEWELSSHLTLISSYHPSQQNTQTGRLTRPMFHSVFERARAVLEQDSGSRI
jgi:uracil-DNA glycosylase